MGGPVAWAQCAPARPNHPRHFARSAHPAMRRSWATPHASPPARVPRRSARYPWRVCALGEREASGPHDVRKPLPKRTRRRTGCSLDRLLTIQSLYRRSAVETSTRSELFASCWPEGSFFVWERNAAAGEAADDFLWRGVRFKQSPCAAARSRRGGRGIRRARRAAAGALLLGRAGGQQRAFHSRQPSHGHAAATTAAMLLAGIFAVPTACRPCLACVVAAAVLVAPMSDANFMNVSPRRPQEEEARSRRRGTRRPMASLIKCRHFYVVRWQICHSRSLLRNTHRC